MRALDFLALSIFILMFLGILTRLRTANAVQRTGFHMMLYMLFSGIVFYLYSLNILDNQENPCPYGSEYIIPFEVLNVFALLYVIFYISDFLSYSNNNNVNIRYFIDVLSEKISGLLNMISFMLIIYAFLHFLTREDDVFWNSNLYLLMMSPEGGLSDNFSKFLGSIVAPIYFVSCIMFGVAASSKRFFAIVATGGVSIWLGILEVSAASRVAGIGVLLFTIYRSATVGVFKFSVIASTALGLYLITAALAGRAIGAYGLDNFFMQLSSPMEAQVGFSDLLTNLFQGALTTGDGLLLGGNFSETYKVLSLSPLPSFIDGFDKIREASEIRLGAYCPMGAVAELANFGQGYWITYCFVYLLMVVTINSRVVASRVSPLFIVAANGIFSLFSIGGFTYPVRTINRILVYTFIIIVIAAIIGKTARNANTRARDTVRRAYRT
ncbi:hypothetical protein SAMN05421890_0356 [Ensifer adhaerens]|nr:hypothetical protein SAMN05421890_0356 [Ensifer adhaerens]